MTLQGVGISNIFPVAGSSCQSWAPQAERGVFIAVLMAHVEISPLFTQPISSLIGSQGFFETFFCASVLVSWPWIFYLHAIMIGLVTTLFILYYR